MTLVTMVKLTLFIHHSSDDRTPQSYNHMFTVFFSSFFLYNSLTNISWDSLQRAQCDGDIFEMWVMCGQSKKERKNTKKNFLVKCAHVRRDERTQRLGKLCLRPGFLYSNAKTSTTSNSLLSFCARLRCQKEAAFGQTAELVDNIYVHPNG